MKKSRINFDSPVQRSLVWKNDKKSLLIHSLIENYPVPAFYFIKNENGYDCLDGKQRSNAIYSFVNNEFELDLDTTPIIDDEGEELDISGMRFENLPEYAQERIRDYNLTIYYFEDTTQEEIHEIFRRLNNGKPLSAVELTRVKAKSILDFQEIARHPAIDFATTEKGKLRFADETLAFQSYAMMYMPNVCFNTKVFRPYIENVVVTNDNKSDVMAGLDYMYNLFGVMSLEDSSNKENARVLRRLKSRTHFVTATYFAMRCIDSHVSQDDFNIAIYDYFNSSTTSVSNEYNSTVGSGSAKAEKVQLRKHCMDELLHETIGG